MNLYAWAIKWGLPIECVRDLQMTLGTFTPPEVLSENVGKSEAWAQSAVRLEASQKGVTLWRNNVGALRDEGGRLVRFGLANDTKQLNAVLKSGDLVGWRSVIITPELVGQRIAQFTSREIKESGWQYTGVDREPAQLAWVNLVAAAGGDAAFATGPGTL